MMALMVDPAVEHRVSFTFAETPEWKKKPAVWPSVEGRSSCLFQVFVKALLVANHKDSCCPIEFFGLLEGSC